MALSISTLITIILFSGIGSNYLYGITGIGVIDDLPIILVSIISAGLLIIKPYLWSRFGSLLIVYLAFIGISLLFLFDNLNSFLYELYKLSIFLAFFPLLASLRTNIIHNIDEKFLKLATVFFSINLLIIFLQYTVSPEIVVHYFKLPIEQIVASQRSGRWVGLFEGINNFGDTAVLLFLLNEIVKPSFYKISRNIFLISVVISTSKHAIVICALIYLYLNLRVLTSDFRNQLEFSKKILGIIGLFLLLWGAYYLNQDAISSKTNQYEYFFKNAFSITDRDADILEFRALHIGSGLSILRQHPFGVGLGVWGDASSKYREGHKDLPILEMSDSYLIHVLVEQGIFILFYLAIYLLGIKYATAHDNRQWFISLLIFLLLASMVTMGLSSGSWPLLFSYIFARLITHSRSLNKKQYISDR